MKKDKLGDLEKARDHFIKAATEGIIGTGFAIKGISCLLKESEGRRMLGDLAVSFIGRGMGLMANLSHILKPFEKSKPQKKRSRKKRARKVKVE
ncbi:MAG TPA: hypothetical protein VHT73_02930 [Thermodesulfobacteriota bacterium]|nr:hypothetical protein [Thermodesulfobacteriota bacterium]